MENFLSQLEKEIVQAGLSKDDYRYLVSILVKMKKEEQESLFALFKEKPGLIGRVGNILKSKKELLESGNLSAWEELILDEERIIESV